MAVAVGAMAGGFTAAGETHRKRTGEHVIRQLELADEGEFPLAEPGGLGAFGVRIHLDVILLQEAPKHHHNSGTRK